MRTQLERMMDGLAVLLLFNILFTFSQRYYQYFNLELFIYNLQGIKCMYNIIKILILLERLRSFKVVK